MIGFTRAVVVVSVVIAVLLTNIEPVHGSRRAHHKRHHHRQRHHGHHRGVNGRNSQRSIDLNDVTTASNRRNRYNILEQERSPGLQDRIRSSKTDVRSSPTVDNYTDMSLVNDTIFPNGTRHACPRCFPRESVAKMRITWLKSYILDTLNLKKPPNASKQSLSAAQYNQLMADREKFDQQRQKDEKKIQEEKAEEADGEEMAVIIGKPAPSKMRLPYTIERGSVNLFDLPPDATSNSIKKACLRVYLRSTTRSILRRNIWINLFRLTIAYNSDGKPELFRSLEFSHKLSWEEKRVLSQRSTVKSLNVTDQVKKMSNDQRFVGLQVVASPVDGYSRSLDLIPSFSDCNSEREFTPYLDITMDPRPSRRKREAEHMICDEQDDEVNCCRYPLRIEFDDFNWDFIIAPERYDAYFCQGECPLYSHNTLRTHANFAQQFNQEATPCCSPQEYRGQTLLHFDDKLNIRMTHVPKLVAMSCGCN